MSGASENMERSKIISIGILKQDCSFMYAYAC